MPPLCSLSSFVLSSLQSSWVSEPLATMAPRSSEHSVRTPQLCVFQDDGDENSGKAFPTSSAPSPALALDVGFVLAVAALAFGVWSAFRLQVNTGDTTPFHRLSRLFADIRFAGIVSIKLFLNPKEKIPVLYKEMKRTPAQVACVFTRRGRIYFIKEGAFVPHVTGNKATFERMESSRKTRIGKAIGYSTTASGDHPVRCFEVKKLLRLFTPPAGSIGSEIPVVVEALVSAAAAWCTMQRQEKSSGVKLYKETLRVAMRATFKVLFGSDLQSHLGDEPAVDDFVDKTDLIASSVVTEAEQVKDSSYIQSAKVVEQAMDQAPEGTFAGGIRNLIDSEMHPHFTKEIGHENAKFYMFALPIMISIVVHWTVLTLIRNPGHLEIIRQGLSRQDYTHLRMCLKEVLRLYPPVSAYMVRRSKKDCKLGNTFVKARSLVVVLPMLLVDDQEFRPERWRGNCDLAAAHFGQDGTTPFYAPFSSGTRSCIARYLVVPLFEQVLIKLLGGFDFDLVDEDPWKNKPTALEHFPDNGIGFKPARDLRFSVKESPKR